MSLFDKLKLFVRPQGNVCRPPASEVVGRSFALNSTISYASLLWAFGESRREAVPWAGILTQEAKSTGFFPHYSEEETKLFAQPLATITDQDMRDTAWKIEALQILLWAAGYILDLPNIDVEAHPNIASRLKPKLFSEQSRTTQLLPPKIIEICCAETLLWFWRCGIDSRVGNETIGIVACKGNKAGILKETVDGDFGINGKPFRNLSGEERSRITSVSRERVHALNWLSGLASRNHWKETPLYPTATLQAPDESANYLSSVATWLTRDLQNLSWPNKDFSHTGTPLHIRHRLEELDRAVEKGKERVREVAGRAYALKGLVIHFKGLMILIKGEAAMGAAMLDDLVANLVPEFKKGAQIQGTWEYFSPLERSLFEKKYSQLSGEDIGTAVCRCEALVGLLFALRVIPKLPRFDLLANEDHLKLLPPSFEKFVASASLRGPDELEFVRAAAEAWHVRWDIHQAIQSRKPFVPQLHIRGNEMDQAIHILAKTSVERGYIHETIDGDFPVKGKPFGELTNDEAWEVGLIARERLRSFNWLCGRAPDNCWDKTPITT